MILVVGEAAVTTSAGEVIVVTLVVVAVTVTTIEGIEIAWDLVTDDPQRIATVQADPGVIDDVMDRMPTVPGDNPGYSGEGLEAAAKVAMALCVKDIVLDTVIARLGAWGVTGRLGHRYDRHG